MDKEQAKDRIFWIGFTAIIVSMTMAVLTQIYDISNTIFYSVIIPMFIFLAYALFLLWKFRKHIRWENLPNIYRGDD